MADKRPPKIKVFQEEVKLDSDDDLYDGVPLQSLSSNAFIPGEYTPLDNCDLDQEYSQEQDVQKSDHVTKLKGHCEAGYRSLNGSVDRVMTCGIIRSSSNSSAACNGRKTTDCSASIMPIAPPLDEQTSHHVLFISHPSNQNWVSDITKQLEAPFLGFKCWFKDRGRLGSNGHQSVNNEKVKGYLKAIIVISQEFVTDIWNNDDISLHSISKQETETLLKVGIVLLLDHSDIPESLREVVTIDARVPGWWTRLICQLCSFDTSLKPSTDTKLSISSSFITSPSVATSNGFLLHSIKSRCMYCGQEIVDTSECPKEFHKNGIKVPLEDYQCAVEHLMADSKFKCHVWCYNVPLSIFFFTLFLCVCLIVIPFMESRFSFQVDENGLQYVHAVLVWLFFLTLYLVILNISRKKMKMSTYTKLIYVNKLLSKNKVLACVENLGLADCNKYYLHFFYFDLGPCLTYLQELLAALHDTAPQCSGDSDDPHHECNGDISVNIDCDTQLNNDKNKLDATITNGTIQNRAAALIFQKSGEYLSHLITKKLETPLNIRHMSNYPCPCQYVEQSAFKMQS